MSSGAVELKAPLPRLSDWPSTGCCDATRHSRPVTYRTLSAISAPSALMAHSRAFQQSATRNSSHDVAADLARCERQSAGDATPGKFLHAGGGWATAPSGGGGSPGNTGSNAIRQRGRLCRSCAHQGVRRGYLARDECGGARSGCNHVKLFARRIAGGMLPAFMGPSGLDTSLQVSLSHNKVFFWKPAGNSTTITAEGGQALTVTGTATAANNATTNRHTWMRRLEHLVTAAATTAVTGFRAAAAQWGRGASTPQ